MGTPAKAQHFFTVRGRGFDIVQWKNLTDAASKILERAERAGVKASLECDATRLVLSPEEGDALTLWRVGEPNAPKEITTSGPFDAVVQTLFAAIKHIAPSIFEVTSPDGRDYRQVLARFEPSPWEKAKTHGHAAKTKEEAFLAFVVKKKWHHPDTGNEVEFISLPKKEQTRVRHRWEDEYGRHLDEAEGKAKKEVEEAKDALHDLEKAKDKAKNPSRKASRGTMQKFDRTLFRAAVRVASTTNDRSLKRELLQILRNANCGDAMACGDAPAMACGDAMACGEAPAMARHEEGQEVDVGDWLFQNGHPEAAVKWKQHDGDLGGKTAAVFPEIYRLAWASVVSFARARPGSRTAASSTALRVAAANKLAGEWVRAAVQNPKRVYAHLGVPPGEKIPVGKLDAAIEKVRSTGNKSLLAALVLAKRLKSNG
jgi:hypothetical protein